MTTSSLARFVAASLISVWVSAAVIAAPVGPTPVGPRPIERPVKPALPGMPIQSNMIESRLGFMIQSPLLFFNNTGVLEYSVGSGALSVMADPLALRLNMSDPPLLIFPAAGSKSLTIDIVVAPDGSLLGGVPGDDLTITGEVTIGPDTFSGVLLRGEITEYMGENGGGTTDFHSFRFDLSGGLLAGLYGPDIAIELTSEMSDFTGDYTVDFSGEAKGNVGVVECTGTIGDFVWLDLDGNGIQDDGEPGLGGVQLILTDADGNVSTATTQSNGFYQFTDLCAGSYTVEVNPASLPPGLAPTLINAPGSDDSNDSNDPAGTTVTLPDNSSSDQNTDFGYVELNGALGDFVWEDLNMDGVQDGNEPGVGGVMVNLYDCTGAFIASTTTNASGFYLFDNLAAGCYQVEFILPGGFAFSPMDQTGDGLDSDPDPTTGFTDPVNLGPGETNLDVDAGIFRPPSAELGDRFWEDVNGNGIQDPGEPGIPGVPVNLFDCDGNLLDSTVTGANGMYLFTDLAAGCYVVGFEPAECVFTAQDVGIDDTADSDADPLTGLTGPIDLQEMESDLTWDGGCYFPAGLGDFLWNDLNQDGIQDPNEPGIEGQTVILLDALMMPTGLSTVTGPNGGYQFTGLPPGSYFVQFTAPAGFVYTLQDVEPDDGLDSDANNAGKTDKVILESGEFDPTIDAGVFVPNQPAISIEKSTNGDDADNPTGPFIPNGDPVLWEYLVTNTGNVTLSGIFVTDDQGVQVSCPTDTLAPGDSMTCTGDGAATVDQYENLGETCGVDPQGLEVCDEDPSHYFGADPSIDIEKATNGEDADVPTGPYVAPGASVTWTYVVTNTGNVTLSDVMVSDDQGVTVTCPLDTLVPGQIMECMADGTAVSGQYANLGTVTGTPPDGAGDPVMDEDPSHYFGAEPGIDIEKATNGDDADDPTGPLVPVGGTVEWTYVVTNTGNVELSNIAVTDSQGVAVSCPGTTLAPGASFTCTASGAATAGQYANIGEVCGNDPVANELCDDDPSHYFGADPSIDIEKATNGDDADTPTGPNVAVGDTVNWTYVVTNTGNVALDNVLVTDSQGVTVNCPATTLAPGASFNCNASGIATAGQYMNLGEVCALDPTGTEVCDEDPSHYFGADPSIDIEKATNGDDADSPTGPLVATGSTVNWTYLVTNTGNVALTDVNVVDDQGVAVNCPATTLAPGASFTCTASGTAQIGQYANVGEVCGMDSAGTQVCDDDPSHYFGGNPSIDIEKATNGDDADNPMGPFITIGEDVNWTYVVTNTGNIGLFNIMVTDNQGVTVTCPAATLAPGASFICTAMGISQAGQYANIGSVIGDAEVGGPVTDEDPSHYFGANPDIDIEKATNGFDADLPTGPIVAPGSTVNWTYLVSNFGNVTLTDIVVTDNQGVSVSCPETTLDPGESFTCTASGIAIVGQYDNVGSVTGNPPVGPPVNDDDPSHYFGAVPEIDLEKLTNGEDADNPTGPILPVGSTVTWTYVITNMGNVTLDSVALNDSVLGAISCNEGPIPALAPGDNFLCSVMGVATAGQYMNLGEVCALDPMGTQVCDDDPSHYLGANPSIDIEKATNGFDADDPTGPFIEAGGAVNWSYLVTNTGNVLLTNVTVTDDQGVSVSCPATLLAPGASFTCTASGIATPGQYENLGSVVGTPPVGPPVRDEDPSHYFGVTPGIDIEKSTNGIDADDPNAGDAPQILPGDAVSWSYLVTNTGNVPLTGINVSDDQGVVVACPGDTLAAGASFTCTANGTAEDLMNTGSTTVPGLCGTRPNVPLYENMGQVSGTSPIGTVVTDIDASHYCNPEVCALEVSKTCLIPMAPASAWECTKPIDTLTMIYDGTQPVRIKAWKGDVGSTLLADIDDIQPGEEISVMGYAGSPNDVIWEVFLAGTSSKIGESKFHLSCSDDEMDGPEDCGLNEGNGKSNESNLLNVWLLEGIVDAGGTLDCTQPPPTSGANECAFQAFPASCETGDADFLTLQYTGGGCGASDNAQDDHICTGSVNGGAAATFTDDDGNSVTLQPGETVTIARNLAKNMTLTNAGGTETNELHTSCSQPIAAGDVYGSLTLVRIDGQGIGTDVLYGYTITNTSDVDIVSLSAIDNVLGPIPGAPSSLAAGQSVTLSASAFLTETTTNIAIVDGNTADGQMCNGMAQATVTILPPPPCDVDGEGVLELSSDKVKWDLTNNGSFTATVETVEISWPSSNGDIIEVKLDGDKIFEGNVSPNTATFGPNDWINDLNKRQIAPGDSATLEFKFDNDVVGPADNYQITVNFEEGCSVTFVNTGTPFECNKPIDALTMIWDGSADPIRVKAWKGDPGSELLLDQSGIGVGDEITVSGYAGSPNDVFWEIFSGGTKLGESNFHLSCSDNDMNGAEDCGKRQGNGKSNDADAINDWILEGMVDQNGPFDCSTLP